MTETSVRRTQVKLVRGPFIRLVPHPDHCTDDASFIEFCRSLRRTDERRLLVADLFSGAGGLSLGLERAGLSVVFSADHDAEAVETHRHHFGGMAVDWDLGDPEIVERVAGLMRAASIDVLAGGPPCQPFSKAGRSGIRYRVRQGLREPHDARRDLWRSFLEVARLASPRVVIMENVPDMALDREMFILRSMVFELEQLGYAVEERVVDAWRYGVPQFRQRLILVGVKGGYRFAWPDETVAKVTVDNAIGDLPPVSGGWRPDGGADGWTPYSEPRSDFQRRMRADVPDDDGHKVFDHITRPVRDDDLLAFELLGSDMRYSELPPELKRYRDDIFDDKYKRLDAHDLSRTITAHIAKDGYWYIHPDQDRTITVREAARLQTFPDWFRFAGPPSAAFRQIGNAVPPMLGETIGIGLLAALDDVPVRIPSTEEISARLVRWFDDVASAEVPWLRASTRWQALGADILLDRATLEAVRSIWPLLCRWKSAGDVVDSRDELTMIGTWIGRETRAAGLIELAEHLADRGNPELTDDVLATLVADRLVTQAQADVAALAVTTAGGDVSEEPVVITKGVLRVAARVVADTVDRRNRLTDGRIAVARLVGYGPQSRRAHLAVMELANSLCTPVRPTCERCPLSGDCLSAEGLLADRS